MTAMRFPAAAILALGSPFAYAQKPLTFDAASVKTATVPAGVTVSGKSMTAPRGVDIRSLRSTGGPGTSDPGRIHYPLVSLKGLLGRAWDSYFEIRGPDWLDSEVVQVDATMPADTTKEQFQEMLGNLITDRFKLKYHVETKEIAGYSLAVAKSGLKMKESAVAASPQEPNGGAPPPAPQPREIGPDGFPTAPPGFVVGTSFQAMPGSRARMVAKQVTMDGLAHALGSLLKTEVVNGTGLKAKYDFTVTYSGGFGPDGPFASSLATPAEIVPEAQEPLPDIFSALQSQLGLKLEPKKVPVQVMVVDHMEKTPYEN